MKQHRFDDDLVEVPGLLIRRLQQAAVSIFMSETAEVGLDMTPVQFGALTTIRTYPGVDQVTLAGLIAYDKTTIGQVVSRLLDKGLIERHTNKQDRRAKQLSITAAGRDALVEMAPRVQRVQVEILSGLSSDEEEVFVTLLKKAVEAVNERSRAPMRR